MKKLAVLALTLFAFTRVAAPARADLDPPVPVRTVPPAFPFDMRRQNIGGIVTINCLIDSQGDVQDLKVVKTSNDAFTQPAIDALRKWKFKPAQRDGAIVPIRVSIPIKFSIND
jgi:protein TonB